MRFKAKPSNMAGFTLLEVLAAVLILSLAYVAVLQSFSVSLSNLEKVRTTRETVFEELISFTKNVKFSGGGALDEDEEEMAEGTLFIEGLKYKLVEVTSESGELATLQMQDALD